jgi:basic amino acid/polyamine antiporter, APA family
MLGAGIYALVGEVGGRVGGAMWTSFLLARAGVRRRLPR